ncbi:MAG: type II toxin-antitoxin system VapC family toxin [Chloroflexota bacterium]
MTTYLADTHSLIWYFARPDLLGKAALSALDDVAESKAELIVPVIVLAELIFVIEKRTLHLDFGHILSHLQDSSNVRITHLGLEYILDCHRLTAIPEMHDRLIVAEAIRRQAILITRDGAITNSGAVSVVW